MLFEHEDIHDVSETGIIGDGSGKANLLAIFKETEAQRVGDSPFDQFLWYAPCPLSPRQERVDNVNVQSGNVCTHREIISAFFICHLFSSPRS